jgi:dTDP-4-dehydrorhamnose reductase
MNSLSMEKAEHLRAGRDARKDFIVNCAGIRSVSKAEIRLHDDRDLPDGKKRVH